MFVFVRVCVCVCVCACVCVCVSVSCALLIAVYVLYCVWVAADHNIVVRLGWTCCNTCGHSEMAEEIEKVEASFEDAERKVVGYAFAHDQDMDRIKGEAGGDTLRLAFSGQADGTRASVQTAEKVVQVLRDVGLKVKWNGSSSTKIAIEGLQWRCRWKPSDTEHELAASKPALAVLLATQGDAAPAVASSVENVEAEVAGVGAGAGAGAGAGIGVSVEQDAVADHGTNSCCGEDTVTSAGGRPGGRSQSQRRRRGRAESDVERLKRQSAKKPRRQ